MRLITLLLEHKRSFLFAIILKFIQEMAMVLKKIGLFTITSSHELTHQEEQNLVTFLASKTGLTIIQEKKIDPTLLAGLTMRSNTYQWEHSLKHYLQRVKRLADHLRT